MSLDGESPEIAMVSRIRVEVRGGTMKAAEEVAFAALDHARMAGLMEGYVPQMGSYSDHFFNRPEILTRMGEPPEPWGEIGLPYYGRLSFVFEPEAAFGGLKQFGYRVESEEPVTPTDIGNGYIVLDRQRPVTREHVWERSSFGDSLGESGESIIEDIRTIKDVRAATARIDKQGVSVEVSMDGWEDVHESGDTLYDAAAKARKAVIETLNAAVVA